MSELNNAGLKSDSEDLKSDQFANNSSTTTANVSSTHIDELTGIARPMRSNDVCRRRTFYDLVNRKLCGVDSMYDDEDDLANKTDNTAVTRRIVCSQKSQPEGENGTWVPSVQIFNSSELLAQLGTRVNSSIVGPCTVVLFYAPWCLFCARLAPHYNALARAFPSLDVVAVDAFHFSSLNSRFGTIAVPNIMVFHNAKAVARFNGTDRTLPNLASFITNVTVKESNGMPIDSRQSILLQCLRLKSLSLYRFRSISSCDPEDEIGPLLSTVTAEIDYLLILSWLFVLSCAGVACVRSATGRRVWNTLVAIGNHGEGLHLD